MDQTTITSLPAFPSSANATKDSATVMGALTTLSGVILMIATIYHYPLTANQLDNFIQEIGAIVSVAVTFGGMAYTIFGLARKLAIKLFAKKTTIIVQPVGGTAGASATSAIVSPNQTVV